MIDDRPDNSGIRSYDPSHITAKERRIIRSLVINECANYDSKGGCLPKDRPCYMLEAKYSGKFCQYFESSVLPFDKELEASLNRKPMKICKQCGKKFPINGKQVYCSDSCKAKGRNAANAAWMRKNRPKCGDLPYQDA